VIPLVARTQKSFEAWLSQAFGTFRFDYDVDRLDALSTERQQEWSRIGAADFLTTDEKRAAAGYGPMPTAAAKYSPDQTRDDHGRWAGGGGPPTAGRPQIRRISDIEAFTRHGLNQVINRGISPAAILDAVRNPVAIIPKPNGSTRYVGKSAVVVLSPSGAVITVWGQ
jgi:hypothetical protein